MNRCTQKLLDRHSLEGDPSGSSLPTGDFELPDGSPCTNGKVFLNRVSMDVDSRNLTFALHHSP